MHKEAFLAALAARLSWLPQDELNERLTFYGEMIDDRMEEGLTEEEAVAGIGTVEDVVSRIVAETPLSTVVTQKVKPKTPLKPWEIVLLVLGAPLWLSLAIAAVSVLFACYGVVWSLLLTLWMVEAALAVSAVAGVLSGVVLPFRGDPLAGIASLGLGLSCAGLAILLFFGCLAATRGVLRLTKAAVFSLKSRLLGKENKHA